MKRALWALVLLTSCPQRPVLLECAKWDCRPGDDTRKGVCVCTELVEVEL